MKVIIAGSRALTGDLAARLVREALIAIPHPDPKRRRGTNDMVRQMRAAGKLVYVHKGD